MDNFQWQCNSRWPDKMEVVDNTIVKITLRHDRCLKEIEDLKVVVSEVAREVNRGMDNNSEEFSQLE